MSCVDSESELIDRAISGDRAALSQLLLLHYDALNQHVSARIPRQLQGLLRTDDVLQQTFVRAAQAINTFETRHPGAFRGWLRTIAENLVRDALRRRQRERRLSGQQDHMPENRDHSAAPLLDRVAAANTTPSRQVQNRESISRLRDAMQGLPEQQRDIVQRRYLQGQSLEQIANATGLTKNAVRGVCYRARKTLRTMMGRSSLYFSKG